MFCGQCGRENHDTASFCKYCGHTLAARRARPADSDPAPVEVGSGIPGTSKKALGIGVAVVAAIVIVAVVVVVVGRFGSGFIGGRSSSDQLAQDVSDSYNRYIASGFSTEGSKAFINDILNMVPNEAVEQVMRKEGVSDRSELVKALENQTGGLGSIGKASTNLDKLKITITFFTEGEIPSSKMTSINQVLMSSGPNVRASEGYVLGARMEITALEDVSGVSKGQTKAETMDGMGSYAIKINDKWYLWLDNLW